jgi:predicted RNA-binding protein with RPS1 domain
MAYREFRDDSGMEWTVWDTYPQSAHRSSMDNLQGGWLTFECGGERRRLIPAPVGWYEEPDDRLRDWLGLAQTAKPRLEGYEARTAAAAAAFSVVRDDAREERGRYPLASPAEDMRSLLERAIDWIKGIVAEPEVGHIYTGKVVKIMDFGAFVNFMGTRDGLVHISELAPRRVEKTGDVVKLGDMVKVKLLGFDDRGKVKLSMRLVNQETGEELPDTRPPRPPREEGEGGERHERRDRGDRGHRRRAEG